MSEQERNPTSGSASNDPAESEENHKELKKQAEKGMRDAGGKLPKDEV